MSKLDDHPLARIVPPMTDSQFGQLVSDIERNGVREPVTLHEGKILDGRHRHRACLELQQRGCKVDCSYRDFDPGVEGSPLEYVISMNVHRRHLNESQRAMIAARLANMRRGRPEKASIDAFSQANAAALLNVGEATLERAKRVLDQGVPELVTLCDGGTMAVSHAAALTKTSPDFQRAVAAKVESGVRPQEARRQAKAERVKSTGNDTLPGGRYRIIYADPPWSYGNTQPDYHPEQRDHYPVMTIEELCDLPVKSLCEDDAVLFLWVTSPILEDAFQVIRAWGFKYKASFVWDKVKHNMGHYNSVRHEFLLVCVRGSCQPDERKLFDSVVVEERTGHSVKPGVFYTIIETLYRNGQRLELFARTRRQGWMVHGFES